MPRPKEQPKTRKWVWITEELALELALLRPEMRDAHGNLKYGAFSRYVSQLIREDLEKRGEEIRKAAKENEGAEANQTP